MKDAPAKTGHLAAGHPFLQRMKDDPTRVADKIKSRIVGKGRPRPRGPTPAPVAEAAPLNWVPAKALKAYSE